jgi:hypothetical protein
MTSMAIDFESIKNRQRAGVRDVVAGGTAPRLGHDRGPLHQVAIALVAAGRADDAIPYASRAVALNPLEEGNYELLIRSLATAGDRAAAEHEQQIAVCEDLLRRELGRRVPGSHVGGPQECACPRGARSGRGRRWTTILTARPLLANLAGLAARRDLRELVVRAELHRVRLGDPTALASARLLSANIDNPALTRLLS